MRLTRPRVTRGALVRMVERDGPAAAAGIAAGDVIVSFNRKPIEKSDELSAAVARTKPGKSVTVEVVRGGRRQTLTVTVAALESSPDRQARESGGERRFGVALSDLTPELRSRLNVPDKRGGALVTNVAQGGAAARAGIRPGDVILEINRKPVNNASDAAAAFRAVAEKDVALTLVWREGQEVFITIPGER